MNYNLDLFWYKWLKKYNFFANLFKLFLNHSGMVRALSKGPEHPKKINI